MKKDLTEIFKKGIFLSNNYNAVLISKLISKSINNISCEFYEDSNYNWYEIVRIENNFVIEIYGYLSYKFPVAILKNNCPKNIIDFLNNNNILIENYYDKYCCDDKILRIYVDERIPVINDNFLYDETIPFNEKLFLEIDELIIYVSSYNFTFEELHLL